MYLYKIIELILDISVAKYYLRIERRLFACCERPGTKKRTLKDALLHVIDLYQP